MLAVACATLVTLVAVVVSTRNGGERDPTSTSKSAPLPELPSLVRASARYPEYRSLRHLALSSSSVVRGTVTRLTRSYREVPQGFSFSGVPRRLRGIVGVVKTDAIVRVERALKGRLAGTIRVSHLGGRIRGTRIILEGEPISRPGRTYVFFVRKLAGSRYGIVGGAQGRYEVRRGRLTLVSDDYESSPVPETLGGMRLATFERSFDALLRAPAARASISQVRQRQEPLVGTPPVTKPPAPPGSPPRP
jgi:hypothetical protein